ncbi:hypothetical protein [Streptomyces sp. NPDC007264]|uniref:hypothetical protein n=1 Tax=Streptomyces sp. NPDC007264 TaxID=3364777 RepID=UPI0036DD99EB
MSHAVLALGVAVLTLAGAVWYLPALADLRAGADRPDSRRIAAAACLTGWGTVASLAPLLVANATGWVIAVVTGVGTGVTAGLWTRAGVQRKREEREAARQWATLRHFAPGSGREPGPSPYTVAALLGTGLVLSVAVATLLMAAPPEDGHDWLTAAVAPAVVIGLFLTIAVTRTRVTRRRTATGHAPPTR